jgi:hypothetical protein
MASTMVARMFSSCWLNSASLRVGAFAMRKPRTWLVTPGGRIASYSGCTEVLVEGTSTPSFSRQPSVSAIAAASPRRPQGFHRRGGRVTRNRPSSHARTGSKRRPASAAVDRRG